MKTIIKIIIIVVLVALLGSLPLNILGIVFDWLVRFIAKYIDFFGWGRVLK